MDITAYFARLGLEVPRPIVPDSQLLRALHFAHCTHVPYENLDILRGRPLSLEADALFEKIVHRNQGGLCFELNTGFGLLLQALGYGVTSFAARYLRGESELPMRRHQVLRVEATDGLWLCDVGIGEVAQREPLALVPGLVQTQYGESYRLEQDENLGWVLWDMHHGQWQKFYAFDEALQLPADFAALSFYCEKHPGSPFNKQEMFSLKTADGRITLDGDVLKVFSGHQVIVQQLPPADLPAAYRRFGLQF